MARERELAQQCEKEVDREHLLMNDIEALSKLTVREMAAAECPSTAFPSALLAKMINLLIRMN